MMTHFGTPFCLSIIHFFRVHIMAEEAVAGEVAPLGAWDAVVAVGVDGEAASREEFAPDFDVAGAEEFDEVGHDDVHAVFVKVAVVSEGEEVEFQGFAFYHVLVGDVGNVDGSKVGLPGLGAEAGEFGAVEFDEEVSVSVFVGDFLQEVRVVVVGVFGVLISQLFELV